jgi:hypothetical protein
MPHLIFGAEAVSVVISSWSKNIHGHHFTGGEDCNISLEQKQPEDA